MTSMDVEQLAVTKIVQIVSRCLHLKPFIDSNDKTLLTDGHIDVHSSGSHSKTTFEGRVDVQVKGRALKGKTIPRTFRLSKTDLTGYSKNQSVLYFIVYIDPKTFKESPVYILLSPFKVQRLIKAMGSQKHIGVDVKSLPFDPPNLEAIVRLALTSNNERPAMRIDAGRLKDVKRITLYTDGSLNLDAPVTLTRDEYDFTLAIETSEGMALYVDEEIIITPKEYIGEATELAVSSGDFVFRNPIRRRVDKDTFELQLSEGLKIRISHAGPESTGSVLLTLRATLRERFEDLGFYLRCVDNQLFSIDGVTNEFEINSIEDEHDLREHFEYLKTLQSLCDDLWVDSSLVELDPLQGRRGRQLIDLHGVMLNGEQISDAHNEPGRILQPMGRWSLQLIVLEDGDEGKWLCRDLFNPKLRHQFIATRKDKVGKNHISRITPYEIVESEHFPFTLNLHLDNLVSAYMEISDDSDAPNHANATVLNLIHAADVVEARKAEFLSAALSLNNWLITMQGGLPHHQINHWQILARRDEMSSDRRAKVRSLRDRASRREIENPEFVEVACAILLGNAEEIDHYLNRLDETERSQIQDWPIWSLHSAADALKE